MPCLSRKILALAALAWLSMAAGPTLAAPAVSPATRTPNYEAYDDAATQLGWKEWGSIKDGTGPTKVLLRTAGTRLNLSIVLPPGTNQVAANRMLQKLCDRMGWSGAGLSSYKGPEGVILRASVPGAADRAGWLGVRLRLELSPLYEEIRRSFPGPVLLVLRQPVRFLRHFSPAPVARGEFGEDLFIRYEAPRTGQAGTKATALQCESGVPVRQVAALGVGLIVWMVFPFVALYVVREQIRRGKEGDPKERLRAYRRWVRGIAVGSMLGAWANTFLLGMSFFSLMSAIGPGVGVLVSSLLVVPVIGVSLVGRLLGLPLERPTMLHDQNRPWWRAAIGELSGFTFIVLMFGLMAMAMSASGPPSVGSSAALAVVIGIGTIFLAWIVYATWSYYRRPIRAARDPRKAASAELTAAVEAVTTAVGRPVCRTALETSMMGSLIQAEIRFADDCAVVPSTLAAGLPVQEVAALVAAAVLLRPVTRREKLIAALPSLVGFLPVFLMLGWGASALLGGRGGARSGLMLVFLAAPVTGIISLALTRRVQRQREDADLVVADAVGPRNLLDALMRLEDAVVLASGLDSSASARNLPIVRRRERLQARLGLD